MSRSIFNMVWNNHASIRKSTRVSSREWIILPVRLITRDRLSFLHYDSARMQNSLGSGTRENFVTKHLWRKNLKEDFSLVQS